MAEKEILIKKADLSDLDGIFYLYNRYMFDSYLLNFGRPFVKRYLRTITTSSNCIALVAKKEEFIGFIMATCDSKRLMFELCFNIGILCTWIKQVLLHPGIALKSVELIFYPSKTYLKNINAEFLFISIEPAYRKLNLGTELVEKIIDLMREKGVRKIKVTTIGENQAVNSFLRKLGFKFERTFMLFKKAMYLYSYNIENKEKIESSLIIQSGKDTPHQILRIAGVSMGGSKYKNENLVF